jgi:NAD(P)-dependent dehydrogenase (short-subunit alcohol dehydrogenase family)
VLAGRTKASIEDVCLTLNSLAPEVSTLAVEADVSSPDQVERLLKHTIERFGQVNVVVHCAGVLGSIAKVGDAPLDGWFEAFVSTDTVCNH